MTNAQMTAEAEYKPTSLSIISQHEAILRGMERYGRMYPMLAIHAYGITKLSTRIGEIERKSGLRFDRQRVDAVTRYGRKCHYMQYTVPEGKTVSDFRKTI